MGTTEFFEAPKNPTVWVCFSADGYDVIGIYTSKAEAQRHMIAAYVEELRRLNNQGNLNFSDIEFDLLSMLDGYIEDFFYIEEHELKTMFD